MKKTIEKDCMWPIRMKRDFKNKFKSFCDKHGYSMNKRVKLLMEIDMEDGK
jgi:hypothetical protein